MSTTVDALQTKMHSALDFDQKKAQVNDAKLRAVAQKVEYDEFEKLVAGAHLKPVKPRSQESAAISKQFAGFVMPTYTPEMPSATAAAAAAPPTLASDAFEAPKTSNDFVRAWRRQCKTPEAKFRYLHTFEPESLPLIFRSELDCTVLDGIGQALRACALADGELLEAEAAWVEQLLRYLCRINRFELTLDLADTVTAKTLAACFDALQRTAPPEAAGGQGRIDAAGLRTIREAYKL